MLSHVYIGVSDFERSLDFYRAVMSGLGHIEKFCELERPWAGWHSPDSERPLFLIGKPYDQKPHLAGNGQMIAFAAPSRNVVDSVYNIALAKGGTSEGAPGLRAEYHEHYYGAYIRDLDGNKLCLVCHRP